MDRLRLISGVMLMAMVMVAAKVSAQAVAQDAPRTFTFSPGYRFTETGGEALTTLLARDAICRMEKVHRVRVTTRRSLITRQSKQRPTSSSMYCTAERGCHPLATR